MRRQAVWRSGRVKTLAVTAGNPGLGGTGAERPSAVRDVPAARRIRAADGRRETAGTAAHDALGCRRGAVGIARTIICDRFRIPDPRDSNPPRGIRPARDAVEQAARDIRALRRMTEDAPLSCHGPLRWLLTASLPAAQVRNDDQGNIRLQKRGHNKEGRDDIGAALTLAAGALDRAPKGRRRWNYRGMAA